MIAVVIKKVKRHYEYQIYNGKDEDSLDELISVGATKTSKDCLKHAKESLKWLEIKSE